MIVNTDDEYETKAGRRVRIYATDGFSPYPVHGAIEELGGWVFAIWTLDGKYLLDEPSENDLTQKQ